MDIIGLGGNSKTSTLEKISNSPKPEFYVWKKGENIKLSQHFNSSEFSCNCKFKECVEQKISSDLIDRLESIREDIGQGLIVTSAYRCSTYQQYLRNTSASSVVATKSQHELGKAADIVPKDGKDVQGKFLEIVSKYFKTIGLSNKFLHVDLRDDRVRRWNY